MHALNWVLELMGGVVAFLDLWFFVTTVVLILENSPNPKWTSHSRVGSPGLSNVVSLEAGYKILCSNHHDAVNFLKSVFTSDQELPCRWNVA